MSTRKRVASAALRVAGFALVAGVFSVAAFGAVNPVALEHTSASSLRRLPAAAVRVKPSVNGVHRVPTSPPRNTATPPLATGLDGAPTPSGPVGLCAVALFVPWATRFGHKASRTRGQPLSVA